MSGQPVDPASESIDQSQRETTAYEGQQGYGVEYENGQYRDDSADVEAETGRSGSYETNNLGGYGTGQPDAQGVKHTGESSASPADPEADQG